MRGKILSFVAVLSIVGTSAVAADMSKWYVQADAGYGWAADAGLNNVSETGNILVYSPLDKLGKSFSYGVAVGYNINENIRTELAFTIRDGFELKDTDTGLDPNYNFKGDVQSIATMANAYYTWNKALFSPYVGAGLGYSQNKIKSLAYSAVDRSDGGIAPGGKTNNFAYQLMAGIDYKINAKWTLDLGYRYADLGNIESKSGENVDPSGSSLNTYDGSKGDLKVHEAKLGLRYNF